MGSAGGKQRGGRDVCGFLCLSMLSFFFLVMSPLQAQQVQLPHPCLSCCCWMLKRLQPWAGGHQGLGESALLPRYLSINPKRSPGCPPGPPISFALMRSGRTAQSLSRKPTSRAAFLINHPHTVFVLLSPTVPPFLCWQQPMP